MKNTSFQDNLDRHGPHLENWSDSERRAAKELIARDHDAQLAMDAALHLERLIEGAMIVPSSANLRAKILANLNTEVPAWLDILLRGIWRPVTVAAVPLLLGFWLGIATQQSDMVSDDEIESLTYANFEQLLDTYNEH